MSTQSRVSAQLTDVAGYDADIALASSLGLPHASRSCFPSSCSLGHRLKPWIPTTQEVRGLGLSVPCWRITTYSSPSTIDLQQEETRGHSLQGFLPRTIGHSSELREVQGVPGCEPPLGPVTGLGCPVKSRGFLCVGVGEWRGRSLQPLGCTIGFIWTFYFRKFGESQMTGPGDTAGLRVLSGKCGLRLRL